MEPPTSTAMCNMCQLAFLSAVHVVVLMVIGIQIRFRISHVSSGITFGENQINRMLLRNLYTNLQLTSKFLGFSSSSLRKKSMSKMSTNPSEKDTSVKKLSRPATPTLKRDKEQKALKKKNNIYIPGIVTLQVLGSGSNGAPAAVYMFTDQSRYLFNCGEGTQRLAHEHKTKLSRLEQIFVTRNTWSNVGGFPGLALTIQDTGVKEIALHGPPYLDDILQSMNRFVVLKSLKVNTVDCLEQCDFQDNVMTVKSFPIFSNNDDEHCAICYVCNLKPRPGALNLEKCVEHGVPPGPLLGILKNGFDVTLDNGKIVKTRDVSEANEKPISFILLDIPSEDFMSSFENQINDIRDFAEHDERRISLIIHFGPSEITEDMRYKKIVRGLSATADQIYLNSSRSDFSGYTAAHRIQYQLNQINPRIFPLLNESCQIQSDCLSSKLKVANLEENGHKDANENVMDSQYDGVVNSMTNYHLRPMKKFDFNSTAKLNHKEYIEETEKLPDFPKLLNELKLQYPETDHQSESAVYPKVTFLGTGSCIPNKTRNVSSILIETSKDAFVLMDCGEGTLGQIIRFFGETKAQNVIENLNIIYVSHLHADHHIGLIGLLTERKRLKCMEKVLLLAPIQITYWLNFYNDNIEPISDTYEIIGNATMLSSPLKLLTSHEKTNISSISTCLVRHCPHSFGIALILNKDHNGKPLKITYSGDTMPCPDLVDLGKDSTILIHEATMEDDLVEEAKYKMHSTISQAIRQGREMEAQNIILTHFSQRYAKLPRMQTSNDTNDYDKVMENVAIAFDNMQVTLNDLPNFHIMYPAMKALFMEHAEEMEQKALKRELKMERKRKMLLSESL